MAIFNNNILFKGLSGQLGKQMVFRKCGSKTVVSAYPQYRNSKLTENQKVQRILFKEAAQYAKNVNDTPELKLKYLDKVKKGESVYHYVLKQYMKKHRK